MTSQADIVVFGSGSFAERIVFDLAATAPDPVKVVVAARNEARLAWLRTAANARATMFSRPCEVFVEPVDLEKIDSASALLSRHRPTLVIQTASSQPGAVIAQTSDAWSQLVAAAGLSTTALFHAVLTLRVARAIAAASPKSLLINCCFPDVANGIVAAAGFPVLCGTGNVAILANAFGGTLHARERDTLKVLAHYQTLAQWRRSPRERSGITARAWVADREVGDVFARFADVQLTPQPVVDISAASSVPLALAIAHGRAWRGHVPGPNGLPGGYPVIYRNGTIALDLPASLSESEAIAWNAHFEEENGLVVRDGALRFTGVLRERLAAVLPDLARGFMVGDLDAATRELARLRERLQTQAA